MAALAPREGENPTALPGVSVTRLSRSQPRAPAIYEPGIVILSQGAKRGYLGGAVHRYDPDHYLVLSVPLPAECEVLAAPDAPMLSLRIDVDLPVLGDLLLDIDGEGAFGAAAEPQGIAPCPLGPELRDAAARLLACLARPLEARVLGPLIVREIYFRVLGDARGQALRAVAARRGAFARIGRVLRRIHADCASPLDIDALAREAAMSPSAFHRHFRAVTGISPLRYVKAIRLHKARMLMLQEGAGVGTTALAVGYQSISQFSREYRRLFGASPRADVARQQGQTRARP
jgi:AraC-like DNA-binding protein